jgi:hypothetical protein
MAGRYGTIFDWIKFQISIWRGTYRDCTMEEAFAESRRKFPNDRIHREADALAELSIRELLGRPKYDA